MDGDGLIDKHEFVAATMSYAKLLQEDHLEEAFKVLVWLFTQFCGVVGACCRIECGTAKLVQLAI